MRVCSSCGRENPDDRDFCECGEYLRWDPTGVVQAVTPEVLQAAQEQAPPRRGTRRARPARRAAAAAAPGRTASGTHAAAADPAPRGASRTSAGACDPGNGAGVQSGDPLVGTAPAPPPTPPPAQPPAPPAPAAPPPATMEQPPVAPAPAPPAQPEEPDPAAITLRLPEGEQVRLGETLAMGAEPGGRARVLALVRNQSGIVDNYELSVRGLPDGWWSIFPNTVYLVAVRHERDVRAGGGDPPPPARAPPRPRRGSGSSRSPPSPRPTTGRPRAAPLNLGIQPFEELKTKLEPERASGRRKASYEVAVKNTANAPVTVALDHEDPDNEMKVELRAARRSRSRPARPRSRRWSSARRARSGSAARRRSA